MKEYIDYSKGHLPDVEDSEFASFWEGTRQSEIRFPRCCNCGQFHWYPCVLCPFCQSADIEWRALKSQPRLFTWTCIRWKLLPLSNIPIPYIVALVEFDEAPDRYLTTNLVECQTEDLYIGMPLEAVFQRVDDKITMPLFKPMKDEKA